MKGNFIFASLRAAEGLVSLKLIQNKADPKSPAESSNPIQPEW